MKLEELKPDTALRGTMPDPTVTVVSVQCHAGPPPTLVCRDPERFVEYALAVVPLGEFSPLEARLGREAQGA